MTWTNRDNTLWRVYKDGSEERCYYAGISHLTSGGEEKATSPCIYCESTIPSTRSSCPGCGGPRLALVTKCNVQIEVMLPEGGQLMDLNGESVLEVRRKGWNSLSPYFAGGGLSVRSTATRYAVWASTDWPPNKKRTKYEPEPEPKSEPKSNSDQTIIRLSKFNLLTVFMDSPVPVDSYDPQALTMTMMLECKTEFFFSERVKVELGE